MYYRKVNKDSMLFSKMWNIMKKLLLICIIIVGIAFVSGCLDGDKATDIKTSTDVSGPSTSSIKTESGGQETTIAVNTDWQAKMNADAQSNKAYAESIRFLTGQNKVLVA